MAKATRSPATTTLSFVALAMATIGASALVDMGRTFGEGGSAERFSAVGNAIEEMTGVSAQHGRRLQDAATWCSVDGDDFYCCGFGAEASCISRGLEYTGVSLPCEVKLSLDESGTAICEGYSEPSGFVTGCECETFINTEPVVTMPPSTPSPSLAEGETMMPVDETPMPTLAEGETMMPADETPMPTLAEGETMMPVDETPMPTLMDGETMMPADASPAPTATSRDLGTMAPGATTMPVEEMTMAPGATMMPVEEMTMAPGSTMMPAAEDMTMAPGATMMPGASPAPTAGSRGISFTSSPTVVGASAAPTAMMMTSAPTASPSMSMAPTGAPTMMSMAPTMAPTMSTGSPTMAPTAVPTAMPTAGSRGLDFGSMAPTSAPTSAPTAAPTTMPFGATDAPVAGTREISGASTTSYSMGGFLTTTVAFLAAVAFARTA